MLPLTEVIGVRTATALALTLCSATSLQAQGLVQRIANAADGRVQFSYPAREGTCGDGRTFMRLNYGTGSNEYYGNINSSGMPDCVKGPARVILEIAARTVIGVRAFVGPIDKPEGVTDLGTVTAKEASDYLLGLSAFSPEAFALRDKLWERDDAGFYALNDLIQYLGFLAFRPPVPAYKHNCAQFLHLRGRVASDTPHPSAMSRPESDNAILQDISDRLDVMVEELAPRVAAAEVAA